jgi:hypothetical protein
MAPPLSRCLKILLFLGLASLFQLALFGLLHNNSNRLPLSNFFPSNNKNNDKGQEEQGEDRFYPHDDPKPEAKSWNGKEEVIPAVAFPEPSVSSYSYIMKANVDRLGSPSPLTSFLTK